MAGNQSHRSEQPEPGKGKPARRRARRADLKAGKPPAASRSPAAKAAPEAAEVERAREPVDINHAGIKDLLRLDGVGEKVANAIIEYRRDYGLFWNVDELLNVTGIGESLFKRIRGQAVAPREDDE